MKKWFAMAVGCATGFAAVPASAAVLLCYGNNCPPGGLSFDNVLVTATPPGGSPTVTGSVNSLSVTFDSSIDALLSGDANGQADVSSIDGLLNDLSFTIQDGYTFEQAIFNLFPIAGNNPNDPLTPLKADSVVISYYTPGLGQQTISIDTNGENFLGIYGTAGERFTSVGFTADPNTDGIQDMRQVRLAGIAPITNGVPEPATWAMLLVGFGAIGASIRKRKSAPLQRLQQA